MLVLLLPFFLIAIDAFAGPWTVGSRTPIKFADTPPLPTFPSAPGAPSRSFSPITPAPIVGNAAQPPINKPAEPSTENSTLKNSESKEGGRKGEELISEAKHFEPSSPPRYPEKKNEETVEPNRSPSQPDSIAKPILPRGTKEPSRPIIPESKTKPNIPDDAFDKKRDRDDDSKANSGKRGSNRGGKKKNKDDEEPDDDNEDDDDKGKKYKPPNYTVPKRRTRMQSNVAAGAPRGTALASLAMLSLMMTLLF